MEPAQRSEFERIRHERDLYFRLLTLGHEAAIPPFLQEALALMVDMTGARQGYIELCDDGKSESARWSVAHGFSPDEVESIRAAISRGIIAEALASGQTIFTPSALLDPRFSARESVRMGRIEAVLCAPIGDVPPRGVVYLQGQMQPGFSEEDRTHIEAVARHLAPLADRLLAEHRSQRVVDCTAELRKTLRLDGVIGRSPALGTVLRQAALIAPLDVNVLLTGDSGTGKGQLARVIHDNGPRAAHPFVALNCAALPETLLESELFGAAAGAHSTATRAVVGKVAAAEHGTLFLDEIGEISLAAQAKLLHLLQSREYYPLGSNRPVRADVRLIAASNVDLQRAVAEHRFREDLFYRLQVLPIRMPSLRERCEDIRELAAYFTAEACTRHKLPQLALSRNAVRALETAEWPGNIRQLAHTLEAAVIRCAGSGAHQIERSHLFPDPTGPAEPTAPTFQEATRRFQATLLRDVLAETGWNIVETARRLDLARSHIYNLIRAFGIERDSGH